MAEPGFESRLPDPTVLSCLKQRRREAYRWLNASPGLGGMNSPQLLQTLTLTLYGPWKIWGIWNQAPKTPSPGVTLGMSPEEVCDRCRTRTEGVSRGGSRPQQMRSGFRLHRWSQGDGLHQQLLGGVGPSLSGVAAGRRGTMCV